MNQEDRDKIDRQQRELNWVTVKSAHKRVEVARAECASILKKHDDGKLNESQVIEQCFPKMTEALEQLDTMLNVCIKMESIASDIVAALSPTNIEPDPPRHNSSPDLN
jgi:hypothetical protein